MNNILNIYTDGGCSGNQNDDNLGGWGAILEYGDNKKELYGSEANTTNNRMELTAVISAFSALKKDGLTIRVFTDSSYVSNCFREKWYVSWEKNGWHNASKKPVENQDLWQALIALVKKHDVSFYRVKGHVNISSKTTDFNKLYEKFCAWNGTEFSFDDFKYITEMNNRADELANVGIDEIR
jgi:ribonuclease HI